MDISDYMKQIYFSRILDNNTILFNCNYNLNQECVICFKEMKKGDEIRTLQCTHKYHKNCIDKWVFIKLSCTECRIF